MRLLFSTKKILVLLSMFALINTAQASIYTNVAAASDQISHWERQASQVLDSILLHQVIHYFRVLLFMPQKETEGM